MCMGRVDNAASTTSPHHLSHLPLRQDARFERSSVCTYEMMHRYRIEDAGLFLRFRVALTPAHSLNVVRFRVPFTVVSGLSLNFRFS